MQNMDAATISRTAIDLIFVSVLMDAGAGPDWRYTDPVTAATLSRSEGLAAASIDLFFNHLARFDNKLGWHTDAQTLMALTLDELGQAMQHSPANPVIGIVGRLQLLNGLGKVLSNTLGNTPGCPGPRRPGDLFDVFQSRNSGNTLSAETILVEVLNRFGGIWPNGLVHHQFNLGDAGYHRQMRTADITDQIVPFHKLSQWLSYSLIEPVQWGGIEVRDIDGLTGLPEYRNGGLLIDTGVIEPVSQQLLKQTLQVDSEAVVEWRALTVFLLDQIADEVRKRLHKNCHELPLASILQGGTWAAGRHVAAQHRVGGSPPLKLAIDGTVF